MMVPKPSLEPRKAHLPKPVPIGGDVLSVIVSLVAASILSVFLCTPTHSPDTIRQLGLTCMSN
jgi:hypothetical protein